jgi:Glyoxalase-like domain
MRIRQVVIDSNDPAPLAAFWAELTGRSVSEGSVYTSLDDPAGRDVELLIQRVSDPSEAAKNRVHLDLYAADPEREAERAVALGARRLDRIEEHGYRWVVLADPQGNEFCIVASTED